MSHSSSRRGFLTAGVALPLANMAGIWEQTGRAATVRSDSAPRLSYRILGKTGLKVTTVGFGCAFTPDASVIERAADLGINYFDTAPVYQGGNNERMVGAALKRKRKDVLISTKVESSTSPLKTLENSLRELQTDYVDVWCLHGRQRPESLTDELLEAQRLAKQQGKIRFAGVSTHDAKTIVPALIQKGVIDVMHATYNFSMDPSVGAALEQASRAGIGVVGMKVMAGGYRVLLPSETAT